MNSQTIDTLRNLVQVSSYIIITVVVLILLAGMLRPRLLTRILHEFATRKYIVMLGVFICLLCSTAIIAVDKPDGMYTSDDPKTSDQIVNPMTDNTPVNINAEVNDIETIEPVAYATQQQNDPQLQAGESKLMQQGVAGQKKVTYSVTSINGKETARTIKTEAVTVQPIVHIVAMGAKIPSSNSSSNSNSHRQQNKECKNIGNAEVQTLICVPN